MDRILIFGVIFINSRIHIIYRCKFSLFLGPFIFLRVQSADTASESVEDLAFYKTSRSEILLATQNFIVPDCIVPDRIIPESIVPDRIVPVRIVPDRIVPDRIVPDRIVPERIVPDRIVPDRIVPDRIVIFGVVFLNFQFYFIYYLTSVIVFYRWIIYSLCTVESVITSCTNSFISRPEILLAALICKDLSSLPPFIITSYPLPQTHAKIHQRFYLRIASIFTQKMFDPIQNKNLQPFPTPKPSIISINQPLLNPNQHLTIQLITIREILFSRLIIS